MLRLFQPAYTMFYKANTQAFSTSIHHVLQGKCPEPESNQWHEDFQSSALPTELSGHLTSINL